MLRSFLMLIFVMTFGVTIAQQRLYPVHVDQKWGLMNVNGQLVVEPFYDNISVFQNGDYAIIEKDGLYTGKGKKW